MQATQQIVESMTEAIAKRQLMPGTKLTEQKLCQQFCVSRTLVRQALNQLSRKQLVTLQPGRGAFIAQPSLQEAKEIFQVRAMLESQMIAELGPRITAKQIAELDLHLASERQALRAKDVAKRTWLLGEFHRVLAQMHGNTVLASILSDLLLRCSLIALAYQSNQSAEQSHRQHVQLVQALKRKQADAGAQLMREHLAHVCTHLELQPDAPAGAKVTPMAVNCC